MYIAIEGVIGVGKTTLARMLQPSYHAELLLEVFEENPFLSDFYSDRERYAFQTQIFFLLSRYHQQHRATSTILNKKSNLIADYTFDKDSLFARINLKGDELEMYYRVHQALAEKIITPELTVYLKADTDILMQRIASRDRPYERKMEHAYIDQLNQAYDEFFLSPPAGINALIIDTNSLNIISEPEDLTLIDTRIKQALHLPPYQTELPLI
jgi:deoxyguanosine kinase